MSRRQPILDAALMDEIERDLDELEAWLRKPPKRRGSGTVPAAGGGTVKVGRVLHEGLRPRPAAFARAIADGISPLAACAAAGYGRANRMTVWRLMRDPKVLAEIERLKNGRGLAQLAETKQG
jgi:hypothetical protein